MNLLRLVMMPLVAGYAVYLWRNRRSASREIRLFGDSIDTLEQRDSTFMRPPV